MDVVASRHSRVKAALRAFGWLTRPHLPCFSHPSGLAGVLVVAADGRDRLFDVTSAGPDFHPGHVTKVEAWHAWEKTRGASAYNICFRPGQESDGGFEFVELLREALLRADLPLYAPPPSPFRGEAEAAASDPVAYQEHIDAAVEAEWPGK
jgi:hypothetical protein